MKIYFKYVIYTFILISSLKAQDYNQLISFAEQLKSDGDYYRAITEYKRVISYYPQSLNRLSIVKIIADCYNLAGHKLEAINEYKRVVKIDKTDKFANLRIASLFHEIGYYYESNDYILNHINNFSDSFRDTLWLISGINCVYLKDFAEAKRSFEHISDNNSLYETKILYNDYLSTVPKTKNRKLAGTLNFFIPGSGYIYSGKLETGIATFITNTLFGTLFYNSIKNGENNSAIFSGLVFTGFHLGSVSGAKQSSDNWNKLMHKEYASKFKIPKTRRNE